MRRAVLPECLSSASLIGKRSAWASRRSVSVVCNAPVIWSAVVRWTLVSLLAKPTEPDTLLL